MEKEDLKEGGGKIVLAVLIVILAGLLGFYVAKSTYYKTHFFNGTFLNGVDASYLTTDEMKTLIQDAVEDYSLTIKERAGEETITAKDIGLRYVDDGAIDELLAKQNPLLWLFENMREHRYDVTTDTKYDVAKSKRIVDNLLCFTSATVEDPENAVMKKNDDGFYEIIPEEQGTRLKEEETKAILNEAIANRTTSVSLEEHDCYKKPSITKDDEKLNHTVQFINQYLAVRIVYKFGDSEEVIDGTDIEPYIENHNGEMSVNVAWVNDVVDEWAEKYESFGKERTFTTHSGETVIVPGGDYGWCMDREKTKQELAQHVGNSESGEYEPIWLYTARGWDNAHLTGTFVEVSLAEQKVFMHENGEITLETDMVSGKATPERETIPGCYAIDAKKSPAVLGSYEVQGYETPVNYWMPFNGGQGLHDATWRSSFGGDIYISNGSHGCVNLPLSAAEYLYSVTEIGMAVVVY